MGAWNGGQRPGLRRHGTCWNTCWESDGRMRSPTWCQVTGDHRPAIASAAGRSADIAAVGTFDVCSLTWLWTVIFLISYIQADWSRRICTAGPIQWRNYNICSLCPLLLRYATVLCFTALASVRLVCGATGREARSNKLSTDSKHSKCRATGDNYPAHNKPVVGQSLVSILGSREIPFPGSRKKIETERASCDRNSIVIAAWLVQHM